MRRSQTTCECFGILFSIFQHACIFPMAICGACVWNDSCFVVCFPCQSRVPSVFHTHFHNTISETAHTFFWLPKHFHGSRQRKRTRWRLRDVYSYHRDGMRHSANKTPHIWVNTYHLAHVKADGTIHKNSTTHLLTSETNQAHTRHTRLFTPDLDPEVPYWKCEIYNCPGYSVCRHIIWSFVSAT